jgi:hypothetical protein
MYNAKLGILTVFGFLAASVGCVSGKEIKDFSNEEKGQMGRLVSKICKAEPGKYYDVFDAATTIKWIEDTDASNKLITFTNILIRQYGLETACNMLYVDSVITRPGSKP